MEIYLSLSTQEHIFLYLHVVCAISTTLNVTGLMFLLKETPPNQAVIRNYLIVIQVLLTIDDVYFDIGHHPIPLFPVLGGYSAGLLNHIGVPTHLQLSAVYMVQGLLIAAPTIPAVMYACSGKDAETCGYDLEWIRSRGSHYFEKRTPSFISFLIITISVLIFGTFIFIAAFLHMLHVLRKDSDKRSPQCVLAIRRSLVSLFVQLVVPLMLFDFPIVTMMLGLAIENFLSFEVSISMFLILPLHSVGHNVILLTITPAYRKIILTELRRFLELPQAFIKHRTNKISDDLDGSRNQS